MVSSYKVTRDDHIFDQIWGMVKPFSIKVGSKYPSIPFEERNSIAMETLWECCNNLKEGKKLLTLYGTVYKNRLFDLFAKKMQSGKYKINEQAASLEELYESVGYQPSYDDIDIFIKEDLYKQCNLLNREIQIVELLDMGYKAREIVKQLKLERKEYNKIVESIQLKIEENWLNTY
ncbi:MAG: hypothetical protein ACI3T9_01100 [Romboutsia timonensis]